MTILSKMFGKYLLLTNTLSCGLMMAAGDMMQQRSDFLKRHMNNKSSDKQTNDEHQQSSIVNCDENDLDESLVRIVSRSEVAIETAGSYDYTRTRNMTAVGLMQGPFHHYFYAVLEKFVPGKSTTSIFKKTLLDQTIASPTCLGIFFVGLGVMENKNLRDINGEVKMKLYDTWKVDCMFWPPTQFFNFLLVPMRYRVIYINFMTMIYDIFLSFMKYMVTAIAYMHRSPSKFAQGAVSGRYLFKEQGIGNNVFVYPRKLRIVGGSSNGMMENFHYLFYVTKPDLHDS